MGKPTKDDRKTKRQLIDELHRLRGQVATLESSEQRMLEVEQALRQSEEKYRTIFDSFYDVYYRTDKEGEINLISPSCTAQSGYAPEEVIGTQVTDYWLTPEDRKFVFRTLLKSGFVNDYELKIRHKDGSVIHASLSSRFVLDSEGNRIGVEGVLRNITERKMAEQELKKSEEKYRDLVESIKEVIYSLGEDGKIMYISPAIEDFLGYKSEEIIGKSLDQWIFPEDLPTARANFKNVLSGKSESNEYRVITKCGSIKWMRTSTQPVFIDQRICGVHGILMDITQHKKAEAALKESEETYRTLVETSPDSVIVVDPDGFITYTSSRIQTLFGFETIDQIIGTSAFNLIIPSQRSRAKKILADVITESSRYSEEIMLQKQDGSCFPGEFSASLVRDFNGNPKSIVTIARDISERKQVEAVLKRERDFTDAILDSAGPLIMVCDRTGRIVRFNKACSKTTGYTFSEVDGKTPWDILLHADQKMKVKEMFRAMKTGLLIKEVEYPWMTKKGEKRIVGWSNAVLMDEKGSIEYIISIGVDITEKKQAEEALRDSEDKYKDLVEKADIAIITSDEEGSFTYFNERFAGLFGYSSEEMMGKNPKLIVHPDDYDAIFPLHRQRMNGKPVQNRYEFRGVRKDGTIIHLEIDVAVLEENGRIVGTRSYLWDMSKRVETDKKIRASLQEKEMLLQEIHHRVKNNMQIISSLLSLQTKNIHDKDILNVFKQSQDRVRSMALVHEKLYGSGDFTNIEFARYIQDLVQRLRNSYCTETPVNLDFKLEDVPLGIDSAIPCGLIVNELVSNAFKHAFRASKGKKNTISISLSEKNHIVKLCVRDNGIGLPGEFDVKKTDSLGLHLVNLLAEDQLGGSLVFESNKGTSFLIEFKRPSYDEPA